MANKLKLTRDQLASFLKDAEQIKQFEQLFALADSIAPDVVNEININAGNAQASANDALAQLQRLADAFELVETPPPIEHNNSIQTDYVDINPLAPTPVEKVGRLYWTDDDATLEFGLEGGVTGQICQQLDFHPKNTGATQINKGMAVMATGVLGSSTKITCARAVANGSIPAEYMLGIAAQNIPVNSFGYVVWFGSIRGFNTTGANKTVPEVWVDGDILYFDPVYPGELTKVEPSAPGLDLPIAIVTNAANNGAIFVRMKTGESMNDLHDVNTATATNGDLLQYYGAGPYWRNVAPSTVSVGTATNLAGGAAGSVPYQSGASTTTFLSIGSNNYVLTSNGTAPIWSANTGTGDVVRATSPTIATPTITTSATVPLVIGGTGTTSTLRLRSTSGVGTTGADIIFQTGNNGATEAMRIVNSGNVGVSSVNPTAPLTVGATTANFMLANGAVTGGSYFRVTSTGGDYVAGLTNSAGSLISGGLPYASFVGSNNLTALHLLTNGTVRATIDTSGNVGIGTVSPDALLTVNTIASFGDGAVGTPSIAHKGDLNTGFWFPAADTIAASTAGSERVRITSAGNVGIGSTSPNAKLDVLGTQAGISNPANGVITVNDSATAALGVGGQIVFRGNYTGTTSTQYAAVTAYKESATVDGSQYGAALIFNTRTQGGSNTEKMRITSAGNVYPASGTTTMTDGFFYIPAAAGAPTGVPTAISGRVPMYYDTTNNKFYIYNGAWKSVALT